MPDSLQLITLPPGILFDQATLTVLEALIPLHDLTREQAQAELDRRGMELISTTEGGCLRCDNGMAFLLCYEREAKTVDRSLPLIVYGLCPEHAMRMRDLNYALETQAAIRAALDRRDNVIIPQVLAPYRGLLPV